LYYSILIQDLLGLVGAEGNDEAETEWMHYPLTAGESIGDIDLLYASKRRRFTVKAIKNSTVLELSQEKFHDFCVHHPDALLLFLRLAVGRLYRVSNFVNTEFLNLAAAAQLDVITFSSDSERASMVSRLFKDPRTLSNTHKDPQTPSNTHKHPIPKQEQDVSGEERDDQGGDGGGGAKGGVHDCAGSGVGGEGVRGEGHAAAPFAKCLVEWRPGEVVYTRGDTPQAFWVVSFILAKNKSLSW
jgi:hypothetical protein